MASTKVVGQTRDVGFEVGVRKTFAVTIEEAWNYLLSPEGIAIWLGSLQTEGLLLQNTYKTTGGIQGKVNVLVPVSHVRLTWKKMEWDNASALQLRVIRAKEKTTISFHQDHLRDADQRNEMKEHWKEVLDQFTGVWGTRR